MNKNHDNRGIVLFTDLLSQVHANYLKWFE